MIPGSRHARMTAPRTSSKRDLGLRLVLILAIVVAVIVAFSPSFSAEWLQWDDNRNFTDNRAWRGLGAEQLNWMFTTRHMGHYQPLSWVTVALDHAVWGMNPKGYHLTNVVLHAATAVAFLFLAHRLLSIGMAARATPERLWIGAAFAALAFAIHPLRVESVAWITERRDVLAGLFFVLAVGAWVRYACADPEHRARWYLAALVLVLLSLLSKAAAIVMPALLLVLDVWPLRRWQADRRRALLDKLPLVALSVVFGWLAISAQGHAETALLSVEKHSFLHRAVQAAYGLVFYAWTTIAPVELSPIYEIPKDLLVARYLLPAAIAVAVTVALWLQRRRLPALACAWFAYAIILSPTSGVAQAGPQLVADRYSYFSCMPFALLAGGAVLSLRDRIGSSAWAAGAFVLVLLGAATYRQAHVWRTSEALWTHVTRLDPNSRNGINGLGSVRLLQYAAAPTQQEKARRLMEARELFQRGMRVASSPKFEFNYGVTLAEQAQYDQANREALLRESWEYMDRAMTKARASGVIETGWRFQYATALTRENRASEALPELLRVVDEWPYVPEPLRVLGLAYAQLEDWDLAAQYTERAAKLQPSEATLQVRLGIFRARAGQPDAARSALQRAIELCRASSNPADEATLRTAEKELAKLSSAGSPGD